MQYISFRNLVGVSHTENEARVLAEEVCCCSTLHNQDNIRRNSSDLNECPVGQFSCFMCCPDWGGRVVPLRGARLVALVETSHKLRGCGLIYFDVRVGGDRVRVCMESQLSIL